MELDQRVRVRYELGDEDARLWKPGVGALVRLRTWSILERVLPAGSRLLDVGGGPGTHAAHLAQRGHHVRLFDPMPRHLELARKRSESQPDARFEVEQGVASRIAAADDSADCVLLMGPLYHLVERSERLSGCDPVRSRRLRLAARRSGEPLARARAAAACAAALRDGADDARRQRARDRRGSASVAALLCDHRSCS